MFLLYPKLGVNALHIVIVPSYFTLVCNVTSVLAQMVTFAMVKVDNFCLNKLIAMLFKSLMENTQDFLFPNRNDK